MADGTGGDRYPGGRPGGWDRRSEGRYRYGHWRGGDDPLAAPFDVREAVDEIGADVMNGTSLRDALRDFLRRSGPERRGLDELRREIQRRRRQLQRSGNLAGTLDTVRAALDQALAAERDQLEEEAAAGDDDARLAQLSLDALSDDTAGAVRELDRYDWHSDDARAQFEAIKAMLRSEVLDQQFAGLKQALGGEGGRPDAEAMARVRDMLVDLNALLDAHAKGRDTGQQFAQFMDKHGEFFPENPQDVDDLIDLLAQRQAAAERMMRSLTAQQRAELQDLLSQAMADAGLESEMSQLRDNLSTLRPGMMRGRGMPVEGSEPLGYGEAAGVVSDLADLEALEAQLGQDYAGASLDDVDVEALERQLTPAVGRDLRALRELEQELERQGYVRRDGGALNLTPKALRRLGEAALRRIFERIDAADAGRHDDRRTGAADERTGAFLPWRFGDEQPLDAVRTVHEAVLREASERAVEVEGAAYQGDDGAAYPPVRRAGVRLAPEDFVVAETERRTGAAVALCVDLSFSMIQEERWGPMKQTALALAHLISTRFRQDALQIIGFDRLARPLSAVQLAEVEPEWVQGTNLQHALMLAGRHLRRHPAAEPVILVVTDGEPTAHLEADGTPYFQWPTSAATLRATVAEIDAVSRMGATLNVFRLGDDPGLARFVDAVARRSGGRVFSPDVSRLGEYVVADYLRTRRGRRRSA